MIIMRNYGYNHGYKPMVINQWLFHDYNIPMIIYNYGIPSGKLTKITN